MVYTENDFNDFLTSFIRMVRARKVVETGLGSGAATKAILNGLPDDGRLVSYDTEERFLSNAPSDDRLALQVGSLTPKHAAWAEVTFLDSDPRSGHRSQEIETWYNNAPNSSYIIVHDVTHLSPTFSNVWHGPDSKDHGSKLISLGIVGVQLDNRMGSFIGRRGPTPKL